MIICAALLPLWQLKCWRQFVAQPARRCCTCNMNESRVCRETESVSVAGQTFTDTQTHTPSGKDSHARLATELAPVLPVARQAGIDTHGVASSLEKK